MFVYCLFYFYLFRLERTFFGTCTDEAGFSLAEDSLSWEAKYYAPIARHIQKVALEQFNVKLVWGGDFRTFLDRPHFQIG